MQAVVINRQTKKRLYTTQVISCITDNRYLLLFLEIAGSPQAVMGLRARVASCRNKKARTESAVTPAISLRKGSATRDFSVFESARYLSRSVVNDDRTLMRMTILHEGFTSLQQKYLLGGTPSEPSPWFAVAFREVNVPCVPEWIPQLWRAGQRHSLIERCTRHCGEIEAWMLSGSPMRWQGIVRDLVKSKRLRFPGERPAKKTVHEQVEDLVGHDRVDAVMSAFGEAEHDGWVGNLAKTNTIKQALLKVVGVPDVVDAVVEVLAAAGPPVWDEQGLLRELGQYAVLDWQSKPSVIADIRRRARRKARKCDCGEDVVDAFMAKFEMRYQAPPRLKNSERFIVDLLVSVGGSMDPVQGRRVSLVVSRLCAAMRSLVAGFASGWEASSECWCQVQQFVADYLYDADTGLSDCYEGDAFTRAVAMVQSSVKLRDAWRYG